MATQELISNSQNLIDGHWVGAASGRRFDVVDPATDRIIASVPESGREETEQAILAASRAQPGWAALTAAERSGRLTAFAQLMRRDAERLALLMTTEQGKPITEARAEITYAVSFLDWAAEEARRIYGETIPASARHKRLLVLRQPVGVCAIITPWNFPSAMITRKIGPALAAGCTVVIKPAEDTPLSALALGELAHEAGLPHGTVNIVTGAPEPIGEEMTSNPLVRKLSFTGSTEVGRILMSKASRHLLRLSLELGGHAPFIVFDDADLDVAVEQAIASKLRNAGQTCICANRFLVQEPVHDEFVRRLAARLEAAVVGRGTTEGVQVGPLINDPAIEKVEHHVEDARENGAQVIAGGQRVRIDGLADRFYAPTLIDGFTEAMRLSREETFGPVAPVRGFASESEAIEQANDTDYGLAAYFFTRDASRLMRVAEALEYGIIGANDGVPSTAQAPFGGIKHSGFGREGGHHVMSEYTEIKYLSWGL